MEKYNRKVKSDDGGGGGDPGKNQEEDSGSLEIYEDEEDGEFSMQSSKFQIGKQVKIYTRLPTKKNLNYVYNMEVKDTKIDDGFSWKQNPNFRKHLGRNKKGGVEGLKNFHKMFYCSVQGCRAEKLVSKKKLLTWSMKKYFQQIFYRNTHSHIQSENLENTAASDQSNLMITQAEIHSRPNDARDSGKFFLQ